MRLLHSVMEYAFGLRTADIDTVEVTKDFYKKMFWVDITDDQAKTLLGNSYPPYGA